MKQKFTLSLDSELIRKTRVVVAKQATSVSKILGDALARAVEEVERFDNARYQALADLDAGLHLGGHGSAPRDTLHDR